MPKPEILETQVVPKKGKKYFTVEEANRALPLVRRIARDIQEVQAQRLHLHAQLSSGIIEASAEMTRKLQAELDRRTDRLEALIDELTRIGVELKDPARGLLDFPAIHEGREVLLCWKGDEANVDYWHEVDGGFSGRRAVKELS